MSSYFVKMLKILLTKSGLRGKLLQCCVVINEAFSMSGGG